MAGAIHRGLLAGPLLVLAATCHAEVCGVDVARDACAGGADPRASCLQALDADPRNLGTRLTLCDILFAAGELESATIVVREGLTFCDGGATCKDQLLLAGSIVTEARISRDRADPLQAERQQLAEERRCGSSLTTDSSVAACKRLLVAQTTNLAMYRSLVEKLLERGESVEALRYLLQARTGTGDPRALEGLLGRTMEQRAPLLDACLSGDSVAACDRVRVAGAADEHLVLVRRGELLADRGDFERAQAALDSAGAIRPGDPSVAQALARLAEARAAAAPAERAAGQPELAAGEPAGVAAADSVALRNAIDDKGVVH